MGSTTIQPTSTDPTLSCPHFAQLPTSTLYRSQSGQQYQKYRVQNYGFTDFISKYQYRIKNPHPYLVNAYWIGEVGNAFGCGGTDLYEVVIERVGYRLTDFVDVGFGGGGRDGDGDGGTGGILLGALRGFWELYRKVGLFLVKDTMIGVDKDSKVKVWLNPKFQLNSLETQPISFESIPEEEREAVMIGNILNLIDMRARKEDLWVRLVKEWHQFKPKSFQTAIEFVQNYLHSNTKQTPQIPNHPQISPISPHQLLINTSHPQPQPQPQSHPSLNPLPKSKQTNLQSSTQSQSLTRSIEMGSQNYGDNQYRTAAYVNVNGNGNGTGIVNGDGRGHGFASLRARAIHNVSAQTSMDNSRVYGNVGQQVHSHLGVPAMPMILQSRHQRNNTRDPNGLSFGSQFPIKNTMSQSTQHLQIRQPQLPFNPQKIPNQISQPYPKLQLQPRQQTPNHIRSFSQQTHRFPEPRHAVQIIKPNKIHGRANDQSKVSVKEEVKERERERERDLGMIGGERMSQSKRSREPGKIKYLGEKTIVQSRNVLPNQTVSTQSQLTPTQKIQLKSQIINERPANQARKQITKADIKVVSQVKQQIQTLPQIQIILPEQPKQPKIDTKPPSLAQPQIPQPPPTPKQNPLPSPTPTPTQKPPQKLQRSLSTSMRIMQSIQKKMQMSRASRLSRTNSDVGNSVSYRDLRSLLQSLHRRNRN